MDRDTRGLHARRTRAREWDDAARSGRRRRIDLLGTTYHCAAAGDDFIARHGGLHASWVVRRFSRQRRLSVFSAWRAPTVAKPAVRFRSHLEAARRAHSGARGGRQARSAGHRELLDEGRVPAAEACLRCGRPHGALGGAFAAAVSRARDGAARDLTSPTPVRRSSALSRAAFRRSFARVARNGPWRSASRATPSAG